MLFGCDEPFSTGQQDCKMMGGICQGGKKKILFAWGRNASGLELPKSENLKYMSCIQHWCMNDLYFEEAHSIPYAV